MIEPSDSARRDAAVIPFSSLSIVDRGGGVTTAPIVEAAHQPERFLSGVTKLPPDGGIPLHQHNCDEQVTILEGQAEVELGDEKLRLGPLDSTFVPTGVWHRFRNVGSEPLLILWVYGALEVTRTFAQSGETVTHLSSRDVTTER
jgi:mannose-6-phosphate isomerase-like protein (cupin superfamily)